MLRALIEGEASAEAMVDRAGGQLRRKHGNLVLVLDGRVEEHHRFLLAMQLRRFEAIEADIAALDQRTGERLEPYRAARAPDADSGRRLGACLPGSSAVCAPCIRPQPAILFSWPRASKLEAQLKAEVADLLACAEVADEAEVPVDMSIL